jgi:glycosyltransferase involved in cell wall biosynthesis
MGISVCIITKNEEKKLPDCLNSLKWADEIIVVDDFSTDNTAEVCAGYPNVRFFSHSFEGFGHQKHYAVSLASNDWVLNIDADEVVPPELRDEIINVTKSDAGISGYTVRRNNLWFGNYKTDSPPGVLRLFSKSQGNFSHDYVHEKVALKGACAMLHNVLLHHPTSFENFKNHYDTYVIKYGTLAAEDYYARGRRIHFINAPWYLIAVPLLVFIKKYIFQGNIFSGLTGLKVVTASALSYHYAYRKLMSVQKQRSQSLPSDLAKIYDKDYFMHHRGGSDEFVHTKGKTLCDSHLYAIKLSELRDYETVLDMGCGCGEIALNAGKIAYEVLGLDFSKDAVELANEARSGFDERAQQAVRFELTDIESYSLPRNYYDVVFFIDVIEHLTQAQIDMALKKIYACLKKGGRLIVHTWPNKWHRQITYPFSYYIGRISGAGRPKDPRTTHESAMHITEQSPLSLKINLTKAGFSSTVWLRYAYPGKKTISGLFYYFIHKCPPFKWFYCDNIWAKAVK